MKPKSIQNKMEKTRQLSENQAHYSSFNFRTPIYIILKSNKYDNATPQHYQ